MFTYIGVVDVLVLLLYVASIVVIGLRVSGGVQSLDSYLLGDRSLPWWALLASIVATETSTATVLSVPGEAYGTTGMRFLQLAMGYVVGRIVIVNTLLPLYFRGQLYTAYEVLHKRFGGITKQFASLLFLIARNLGDGLRLYLAAIALEQLAGLPFVWSVIVTGSVTIVYTVLGGLRSVVWNDCVQFLIYVVGGIASVFVIESHIEGGWDALWSYAEANQKLKVFEFSWSLANPYTFYAGLVGGMVLNIGTHGTDHMMVQRYLSARSHSDASRALLLSGVLVLAQFALFLFIGVELACYYDQTGGFAGKPDQVFAHFIVHHFPRNTGLAGLMLAAILAAALSSSLNASASALINDFYVGSRKTPASVDHLLRLTRYWTVVFGIIQIVVAIFARGLAQTVVNNALAIAGFTFGLLLGVFALGMWTRRTGQGAAVIGMTAGLVVLLYIKFYLNASQVVIAHSWFALIGSVTTFAVGYAASWILPRKEISE